MENWLLRSRKALYAATKSGCMTLDRDMVVRWITPSVCAFVGKPEDEILGRSALELLHPDDLPLALQLLESEKVVSRAGLPSHGHRHELCVRLGNPTSGWTTVMVHGVNLLDDPEVQGFFLQLSIPNQERQTMLAFHAAASGAPLERSLDLLIGTLVSRDSDHEPGVILCDANGVCLAATRNVQLKVGEHRDSSLWQERLRSAELCRSVPIRNSRSYAVLGWLEIAPTIDFVHPFDAANATMVAISAALLFERAMAERELVALVETDPLTGVANRRSFEALILRAQVDSRELAIAYLDVDDFKSVNDTAGHAVGDQVLQAVASRLTKGLREGDVVARLGGDEFAVICFSSHPSPNEMAERIRAYVNGPAVIDGQLVAIRCSVGVASGPGTDAKTILRRADAAMFAAKRARKQQRAELVEQG